VAVPAPPKIPTVCCAAAGVRAAADKSKANIRVILLIQ